MTAADTLQLALRTEDCKPSGKDEYTVLMSLNTQFSVGHAVWGGYGTCRSNLARGSMSLKTDFQNL